MPASLMARGDGALGGSRELRIGVVEEPEARGIAR